MKTKKAKQYADYIEDAVKRGDMTAQEGVEYVHQQKTGVSPIKITVQDRKGKTGLKPINWKEHNFDNRNADILVLNKNYDTI